MSEFASYDVGTVLIDKIDVGQEVEIADEPEIPIEDEPSETPQQGLDWKQHQINYSVSLKNLD